MSEDFEDVGFVIASEYRAEAMGALHESPRTPTEIADAEDVEVAHVSRALSKLRERGLIELLVDEERKKGRIYGLSDAGADVVEQMQDIGRLA